MQIPNRLGLFRLVLLLISVLLLDAVVVAIDGRPFASDVHVRQIHDPGFSSWTVPSRATGDLVPVSWFIPHSAFHDLYHVTILSQGTV